MPERNMKDICAEAVSSVLERMFFTAPMGMSAEHAEGDSIEARLVFRGRPCGEFRLRVSDCGARMLASGFLGEEEESLSRSQTEQVVCELANMLCGSVVSQLESEESIDLSAPELVAVESAAKDGPGQPETWQSFELEAGLLSVALHLEAA